MTIEENIITASEGKVLRRKGTEEVFGMRLVLGYSYYIGGVLQDPPHLDIPEDFEEIDAPEDFVPDIPEEPEISDSEALSIILGE